MALPRAHRRADDAVMDVGLILSILVGLAIALAIVAGGFAARVLMHAAERQPSRRTGSRDR